MSKHLWKLIGLVGPLALALALPPSGPLRADTGLEGVVNINTASNEELELLPGVGPAKARLIASYRQQHAFRTVEELARVKGIGPRTVRRLRPHLVVRGPTTARPTPRRAHPPEALPTPAPPPTPPQPPPPTPAPAARAAVRPPPPPNRSGAREPTPALAAPRSPASPRPDHPAGRRRTYGIGVREGSGARRARGGGTGGEISMSGLAAPVRRIDTSSSTDFE